MNTQDTVEKYVEEFCEDNDIDEGSRKWINLRTTLTTAMEEAVATYQTDYEQKHIASAVEIARKEEREKIVEWANRQLAILRDERTEYDVPATDEYKRGFATAMNGVVFNVKNNYLTT